MSYYDGGEENNATIRDIAIKVAKVSFAVTLLIGIMAWIAGCASVTQVVHDDRLVEGCYSAHTAAEAGFYVDGRFVKTGVLCTKDLPECYYFKSNNMGVEVTVGNQECK